MRASRGPAFAALWVLFTAGAAAEPGELPVGTTRLELLEEGARLHDQGRFDEAIALYRRILEVDPGDPAAQYELVYANFAKGDYLETIALAERIIGGEEPAAAGVHVFLGAAHGLTGAWDRAEVVLRQGLAAWPDDEALRFNLALSLAAQGKTEPAVLAFEECLRRSPYSALTWRALGDTLYDASARGRAVAAYARSLTLEDEPGRADGEVARRLWEMILEGVPLPAETGATRAVPLKVKLPGGPTGSSEDDSSTEAVAVSMVGVLRYQEAWKGKSDATFFAYALDTILDAVSDIHSAPENGGFWGPFVLSYFDDMRAAGHMEALAYDIRCAAGDPEAERWRRDHATEMRRFRERSVRWAVDWVSTGIER